MAIGGLRCRESGVCTLKVMLYYRTREEFFR
jgi:hypothetical protein